MWRKETATERVKFPPFGIRVEPCLSDCRGFHPIHYRNRPICECTLAGQSQLRQAGGVSRAKAVVSRGVIFEPSSMIRGGCTRRQAGLTPNAAKSPSVGISRCQIVQRGRFYGPKGLIRRNVVSNAAKLDQEQLFPVFYDTEKEQSRKYRRTVRLSSEVSSMPLR